MHIKEFEYDLPEELIAQHPAEKREASRLMILDRKTGSLAHKHFYDVLECLNPGDCLVLNDSKVIPARLHGFRLPLDDVKKHRAAKEHGAKVELLLLKHLEGDEWQAMVRPGKKLRVGDKAAFFLDEEQVLTAEIKGNGEEGTRIVAFSYEGAGASGGSAFYEILEKIGRMPLPPYIRRENEPDDTSRYQTVYCRERGSAAAPTAGLHFTGGLLDAARDKGVKIAFVTLHVGLGTFRPVKCERIEEHTMHFEHYHIDAQNASIINETKENGGRIICVGTTSARTLESAAVHRNGQAKSAEENDPVDRNRQGKSAPKENWHIEAGSAETGIFIYPGYSFKMVDALITNFHLPGSTLLMLVSALYDREKIMAAYEEAIREQYRFFSYGDAMLIL